MACYEAVLCQKWAAELMSTCSQSIFRTCSMVIAHLSCCAANMIVQTAWQRTTGKRGDRNNVEFEIIIRVDKKKKLWSPVRKERELKLYRIEEMLLYGKIIFIRSRNWLIKIYQIDHFYVRSYICFNFEINNFFISSQLSYLCLYIWSFRFYL